MFLLFKEVATSIITALAHSQELETRRKLSTTFSDYDVATGQYDFNK